MLKWPSFLSRRLRRNEDGVSAVEFSLLAPFMVVGALSTVDAGMAVYEKMMMTQVLRAGAASAIGAAEESEVRSILQETAAGNFTVVDGSPAPGELAVDVLRYCICPENTSLQVACSTTCASGGAPQRFYQLTATFQFQGVMLPSISLDGEIAVLSE